MLYIFVFVLCRNDGAFTETTKEVDLLAPPTTNSPQDNDTSPQTSSPGLPSAEPTPQVSPASEPADHLSRKLGNNENTIIPMLCYNYLQNTL